MSLIVNDNLYQTLLSSLNYGVAVINPNGNFVSVTSEFCKLFRYSETELLKMSVYDITQTHDIEMSKIGITKLLNGEVNKVALEKIYRRKGGSFFLGKIEFTLFIDNKQQKYIVGMVSENFQEILNQKQREKKFENIIELAEEVIFNVDVSGNFTYVNSQAVKLTGFSKEELLTKNYKDLIFPSFQKKAINFYSQHFIKRLNQSSFKFPIQTKGKKYLWLDQNLNTMWNEDKSRIIGFTAVSRDVTLEVLNENSLLKKKKEIVEKNQILSIIQTLQNEFITGEDLNGQILSFLDSMVIFTKSTFGFIGEVIYENNIPVLKTHAITGIYLNKHSKTKLHAISDNDLEFKNFTILFKATLKEGKILISNNPTLDKKFGGKLDKNHHISSFVGIPVFSNSILVGIFGFANKKNGYNSKLLQKLEPFVSAYSVMIQALRTNSDKEIADLQVLEKDTLLKEIHHRVKNNMQVISSLLTLTAKKFGPEIQASFEESKARINTMALVHEQLYQTKNLKFISVSKFLLSIINQSKSIYVSNYNVQVKSEIEDYNIDTDKAITLGLIVNEIISNCYKHAFKGSNSGEISIVFKIVGEGKLLTISDNGKGVENMEVIEKSNSLGYKLIINLTKQLKGKVNITNKNGLRYELIF